jgi:SAM-dependent methyltransferase
VDLFTPRQLLVGLEYVQAAREILNEMRDAHIPADRVEAVGTYLAFFVAFLADRNSTLCAWFPLKRDSTSSLTRAVAVLPPVFVERQPLGLAHDWLARVLPAIEAAASVTPATSVYLGDARKLPFADDFFDAVVTDPPYYDNIQYDQLTDFYWPWERGVLDELHPVAAKDLSVGEYITSKGKNGPERYRESVVAAFKEILRVLKPGRRLCLFLFARSDESFQDYFTLCQSAGFEFVDVRTLPKAIRRLSSAGHGPQGVTYLIYLRKPESLSAREPLIAGDASAILEAANAERPVLYGALAEFIEERLPQDDLATLMPYGGKGTQTEQLMEVIAEQDPRELLNRCFGLSIRQVAKDVLPDRGAPYANPAEALLQHFGFAVPSPSSRVDGANQVAERLGKLAGRISQAADLPAITGPFLDGCTAIERFLRISIWGWTRLLFRADCGKHLISIIQQHYNDANRRVDLRRLSFGEITALFRKLPDYVAQQSEVSVIEQKFGRKHIYLPVEKKAKFAERLDKVVAARNKVEHNKDDYRDGTPVPILRDELGAVLLDGSRLIADLADAKAVPRVAEPFEEIRDQWNRIRYRLALDDGSDLEAQFSVPLKLGTAYLYFGSNTNPRPVDPLVLLIDDLGQVN